jgi:hypothetical protein
MTLRKTIRLIAGCLLMCIAAVATSAETSAFRCRIDIEWQTGAAKERQESIVAVPFDADVYAGTRDGFPDVRVFDAAGHETPFLLEKAAESRSRAVRIPCASHVISLHEEGDGLDVVLQLDDHAPSAAGLAVHTPLSDYERRVRVFGSRDGREWTPLVDNGIVFDYTRYMDVSNREVQLPKNEYRWFKVAISDISDAKESPFLELTRKSKAGKETERIEKTVLERRPFRIDRIEFWGERTENITEDEKRIAYPVEMTRVEEDAKEKSTVIDIRTHREPLVELTLETSSRNFSRDVKVQTPVKHNNRTRWNEIASGHVSGLEFGGYRERKLQIALPEGRYEEYRIVIRNEDNPPLKITGIKTLGSVYRAMFLAEGGEKRKLFYGNSEIAAPKYDAVSVLEPLRLHGSRVTEGRLGKETIVGVGVQSSSSALRDLLGNRVLIVVTISFLVALLALALFRAARRINEIPKE